MLCAYSSLMVGDFFYLMFTENYHHVSVLQTKIWVSTYSWVLAVGQVKPDLQEGRDEDHRHRDHTAQLSQHQVGDSRFDMNTILDGNQVNNTAYFLNDKIFHISRIRK